MKKNLVLMFAVIAMLFSSCSKDDGLEFPMNDIHGTWKGTAVKVDGEWVNITKYPYTEFAFSISFFKDGTYYGRGYFGNGEGTYKVSKSTIYTYVDGEEYARYDIKSMSNNKAELTMNMGGKPLDIRAEKE